MLNENIKTLRKAKGLSQEELALKLHVVRQTVSKWETGLSVPDAGMLIALADELDTSVSDLLGEPAADARADDVKAISEKLEVINLQLAEMSRARVRTLRLVLILVCVSIAMIFAALAAVNGAYLDWDYSDPALAAAGTILHGFEFVFVRLAPLVFLACVVGLVMTRRSKA